MCMLHRQLSLHRLRVWVWPLWVFEDRVSVIQAPSYGHSSLAGPLFCLWVSQAHSTCLRSCRQGAIHNAGCSWFQIAENTIAKIHFTGCGYGAVSAVCGRWLANPGVHSLQRPKGQVYEHLHSVGASTSPALVGMGSRVHHVVQAVRRCITIP